MSCETTWTLADLAALEKAIAQGVKKVKYTDKEIEYRDLDEMLSLLSLMKSALGCTTKGGGVRLYARHSKGLC